MTYEVFGARVNVVATVRYLGQKFRVHRPVEPSGQRRRKGWMLSHDGVWMSVLPDQDQEAAVSSFKAKLEETFQDVGSLLEAIENISVRNRTEAPDPVWR